MEATDVLKKAVGEDTLIYEKKGQDTIHFHSYAKLLFSTNEMPQNLEDKSDAFYRRLLILDMNQVVKSGEKDLHLKEKVQEEFDYAIHMAMIALKGLYQRGHFTESERSKSCVREIQRASDSICAFVDEMLVREQGKRLKRSQVFNMYEEYCKENVRFCDWLVYPTYDNGFNQKIAYTGKEAWINRILAIVAVLFILAIMIVIIVEVIKRYKRIWDEISQMFLVGSLSGIVVLGDIIRGYLPVNLILLFGFINVGIMLLRVYLQKKFDYL